MGLKQTFNDLKSGLGVMAGMGAKPAGAAVAPPPIPKPKPVPQTVGDIDSGARALGGATESQIARRKALKEL